MYAADGKDYSLNPIRKEFLKAQNTRLSLSLIYIKIYERECNPANLHNVLDQQTEARMWDL